MNLWNVEMLMGYWARNPPPYVTLQIVARWLGWEPVSRAEIARVLHPSGSAGDLPEVVKKWKSERG